MPVPKIREKKKKGKDVVRVTAQRRKINAFVWGNRLVAAAWPNECRGCQDNNILANPRCEAVAPAVGMSGQEHRNGKNAVTRVIGALAKKVPLLKLGCFFAFVGGDNQKKQSLWGSAIKPRVARGLVLQESNGVRGT